MPFLFQKNGGSTETTSYGIRENSAPVTYHIQIDNDSNFSSPERDNFWLTDNFFTYTFASDGTYYWRIRGMDNVGNAGNWANGFRLTIDTKPPENAPELTSPGKNATLSSYTPLFSWTSVSDPSGVTYTLEIVGRLTKTGLALPTYTLTSGEALPDVFLIISCDPARLREFSRNLSWLDGFFTPYRVECGRVVLVVEGG